MPSRRPRLRLAARAVVLAVTAAFLVGASAVPPTPTAWDAPLYVDTDTWATHAATTLESGSPAQRAAERIAAVPQARWVTDADDAASVDRYVSAAVAAGSTGVLVLYSIPHRDCGSYSAGGFTDADAYQVWIREIREGIADRPVVVIVEPDAVTAADCLSYDDQLARLSLLQYAARTLSADPSTAVYIDGGHSRWLSAEELASRLIAIGVTTVRGFSLNVSNFLPTAEQIAYGERVSSLLGGYHYVIDTSRNGNGPAPDAPLNWCNPTDRALGAVPTTVTAGEHADAYLWIKHPGESDGACRPGEPRSGLWFADYAIDLVDG